MLQHTVATEQCVHIGRIIGGDRGGRDPGGAAPAGAVAGKGKGQERPMPQQLKANYAFIQNAS